MLKRLLILVTIITCMIFQPVLAEETEAPVKKITEMLYPTVMIDLSGASGSGTIIFSNNRVHESWKDEGVWTLVITNHHVIDDAISISEEFDPKK